MRTVTRRRAIQAGSAGALTFLSPMINIGRYQALADDTTEYSVRTIDLVNRIIVIDMLSLLHPLDNLFPNSTRQNITSLSDDQLGKALESGVTVFHPAINFGGASAQAGALDYVGRLNSVIAERSDYLTRIDESDDFAKAKASERLGVIIGIQNADHFHSTDDVDRFYQLGQRVSQLTYNTQNFVGTGSTDRHDSGLSEYGIAIVERMNEVGMAIDTSHCGDRTTIDAIETSNRPVLITHSNCRALNPGHPRCKPDDIIKSAAAKGSVMGITGVRNFVRNREPTNIDHLIDHIDHVVKITGIDHVGIGSDSDLDGYDDMTPELLERLKSVYRGTYGFRDKLDTDGFDHPKRIYRLTEGLIRRGYSDENIAQILGDNFRRVLTDIWRPGQPSAE